MAFNPDKILHGVVTCISGASDSENNLARLEVFKTTPKTETAIQECFFSSLSEAIMVGNVIKHMKYSERNWANELRSDLQRILKGKVYKYQLIPKYYQYHDLKSRPIRAYNGRVISYDSKIARMGYDIYDSGMGQSSLYYYTTPMLAYENGDIVTPEKGCEVKQDLVDRAHAMYKGRMVTRFTERIQVDIGQACDSIGSEYTIL